MLSPKCVVQKYAIGCSHVSWLVAVVLKKIPLIKKINDPAHSALSMLGIMRHFFLTRATISQSNLASQFQI